MTEQEIQKAMDALPAKMTAKGIRQPEVSISFRANQTMQAFVHWNDGRAVYQPNGFKHFDGNTADRAISEISAWIDALPSADETRRNQFLSALGGIIDLGKELGIDVDYVNPLRETMKRLAENAITDQRSAAESSRADQQREAAE